ncbi:MAG: DUF262 domain-containing HNH endonuclease family protein [Oscillospiraceae bacterium]|nr:DUF262 domain-containing HNH endonuclease family protein [Oscillospiraceae bacterium]
MQEAEVRLKSLACLQRESIHFTVDLYQRGFRWTQTEVRELLDDVRTFSLTQPAESGAFYCLQPVVVSRTADGRHWNVIDGQQRLTTLYLFYCCYSWVVPPPHRYNLIPFTLTCKDKPRMQAFLDALAEVEYLSARKIAEELDEYENDIDCHYLLEAYQCIGDYLQHILRSTGGYSKLRCLKETFDRRVMLIWYEVTDCDPLNEAALFTKLNTGRIQLTNAELIKALLLERRTADREPSPELQKEAVLRMRIAEQWNAMEAELADQRFWSFLTGARGETVHENSGYNSGYDPLQSPTRLDYLFLIMALELNRNALLKAKEQYPDEGPWIVPETDNNGRFPFCVFSLFLELKRLHPGEGMNDRNDAVGEVWETVRDFYRLLRSWYESPWWYHRIGFLTITDPYSAPERLLELRDLCAEVECDTEQGPESLTETSEERILRLISREVFGSRPPKSHEECREWLSELCYSKHTRKIRQVLLLYNLAYLEVSDRGGRFPFELYRDARLNWDLEHINAVSDTMPGDDRRDTETNSRRQWLKKAAQLPELERIVTADGRRVQELLPELLKEKRYLAGKQPGTRDFIQVYEAIIRFFGGQEGPDHSIGNLTLLDGGINRSYRNDVFPLKRKAILERSAQGIFIPLCTRKVFMKGFRESADLMCWRESDKKAYTEEIVCFLCSFLNLEELQNES